MTRYSRFARDLHAIHGEAEFRVVSDAPPPVARSTRLALSFLMILGLIVLTLFAFAMALGLIIFAYSAFVPHSSLDADLISEAFSAVLSQG